jgi:hypothetical protein
LNLCTFIQSFFERKWSEESAHISDTTSSHSTKEILSLVFFSSFYFDNDFLILTILTILTITATIFIFITTCNIPSLTLLSFV